MGRSSGRGQVVFIGGNNRYAQQHIGGIKPTPAGRLNPRRDNGYADRAEALGQLIEPHPNGCWRWTGDLNVQGYGPYRTVWDILRGEPVPRGHHLHHTCHEKRCVNPDHLQILTVSKHLTLHAEARRAS